MGVGGGGGTGGATEATLLQVRNRLPLTLGQKVLAESLSVVLASDQQLSLINDANNRIFADTLSTRVLKVDASPDRLAQYTYLDLGTEDQRINTITYSSASLALNYTETFTYSGTTGNYVIAGVQRA